jgi:hypothetical protein
MTNRAELETTERAAVARLLKAAHDALMDNRLDGETVWHALGLIATTLDIAAGDIKAGGRAALLDGAAIRLGEHINEAVSGRLEQPPEGR